jgi:phosphoribosylaminoimidazole carboxylase PurK protein
MAPRLGILGNGQLSLMLRNAARDRGWEPAVYGGAFNEGSEDQLRRFLASVDVVAFESEFVPTDVLALAAEGLPCRFFPSLKTMERMRDKLQQKEVLQGLGIPTAPWVVLREPWQKARGDLWKTFPKGMALKWAQLGYDGLGTYLMRHSAGDLAAVEAFLQKARDKAVDVYVEALIPFKHEVAMVCVRSEEGAAVTYPLVVSENRRGVCHKVYGPARSLGVSAAVEEEARRTVRKLGEAVGLAGAYAVEFFLTAEGDLFVNEIAPRVHNTGHYSQDACEVSQFANHWRALLGEGPADPVPAASFAMLNLLGPQAQKATLSMPPDLKLPPGSRLQWYGKHELRPGRKMGHINVVGGPHQEHERLLEEWDRDWQDWCRRQR